MADAAAATTTGQPKTSQITITSLPAELLALIAVHSDVLSLLSFSRTSRSIREAVFNSSVTREVLLTRHDGYPWAKIPWDTAALSQRAGADVHIWLRFALAVESANTAMQGGQMSNDEALTESLWTAELAVLDHPICYYPRYVSDGVRAPTLEIQFASLVSDLCAAHQDGDRARLNAHEFGEVSRPAPSAASSIWRADPKVFKQCAIDQQTSLHVASLSHALLVRRYKLRQHVWPYGHHAIVPDIKLPVPSRMQFYSTARPGEKIDLPLPFVTSAHDTRTDSFSHWYDRRCEELSQDSGFLFEGTWQGYYSVGDDFPDPPMVDISFVIGDNQLPRPFHDPEAKVATVIPGRTYLRANDCKDAIDTFDLRGSFEKSNKDNGIKLTMEKRYRSGLSWTWYCRITPFGIVGHWTGRHTPAHRMQNGVLWLWKREWSE